MKLRLFPQEPAGLVLLAQMAGVIVAATGTLSEILGAQASQHERLTEELHEHESKSLDLHFALLTHMRTSFVNPLPREDMYALSRYLNEAMEKLDDGNERKDPLLAKALNKFKEAAVRQIAEMKALAPKISDAREQRALAEAIAEAEVASKGSL